MKSAALRHPARLAGASLLRLQSDARLAELATAGHEAAFDAIVDRYRTPLLRYCAGIVGPSRAEDAVQQTLINAHEAMTRTDDVRHLKSWLYRIAHNASLNVLRAVRDDMPLDEATLGARAGGRAATSGDPDESFARSEQFRATLAALQALPERQRAALVLRELEGRSHEEIAEALGVTKGSARQHLMRARVAVRSAVTAITPYPLVARFAELLSGGGSAGWVDAAAGAGASATLMKFGAGIAATGALVGGAVGTQHAMRERPADAAPAARATADAQRPAERVVRRAGVPVAAPVAVREGAARSSGKSSGSSSRRATVRKRRHTSSSGSGAARVPARTPAASLIPAAAPESAQRGREQADGERGRRAGERHRRGSDDHPNSSSGHGRKGRKGDNNGRDDRQSHGDGKTTRPDSSSGHTGKSGESGKGKDDDHTSSPTTESSSGSGSIPETSGSSKGDAKSISTTAPTTTTPQTSTAPATSTSGDTDG
jgi:RNA polymerase sigma factor (sigma-70 family)